MPFQKSWARSCASVGGQLRASSRLLWLIALTQAAKAALRARLLLRDDASLIRLELAQLWARCAVRTLGVTIHCRGEPPIGRVLLVANHRSYMDVPVLLSRVPVTFLAKAEIGEWPVFGGAARLLGAVFVRREQPESRYAARVATARLLAGGISVAAFPEGTTSRGPGLGSFAPGLFAVAEKNGFPVVPVAIAYALRDDAWVDADSFVQHFLRRFAHRTLHVHVVFGPVLHSDTEPRLRDAAWCWIAERLAELEGVAPLPR